MIYTPTIFILKPQTWQTLPETNSKRTWKGTIMTISFNRKCIFSNHQFSGATVDGWNPAPPGMYETL